MGKFFYLAVVAVVVMVFVTGRVGVACKIHQDLIGFSLQGTFERISEVLKGRGA